MNEPHLPQVMRPGFLDLPEELDAYATSRFVVLPLPYDATCSYGVGCRFGPARILEASAQVEWYDEELDFSPCEAGICTLRPVDPLISGPEVYFGSISPLARAIIEGGKTLVGIGGEHSVTWGLYRGLVSASASGSAPSRFTVVQIDAHLDLRETYQGSSSSHACVMRRILDDGTPVVHVGVRSGTEEEWNLVRERQLPCFPAREIVRLPDDEWIPRVLSAIGTHDVYLSIDLDGFDPSVLPGTGTPEPGGLGYWQGLALIRQIARRHRILAFDAVELEPIPGSRVSEFAAAKILYKTMGYILEGSGD